MCLCLPLRITQRRHLHTVWVLTRQKHSEVVVLRRIGRRVNARVTVFWRHSHRSGRASTLTGNHAGECAVATVSGSDRGLWAPLIDGRLDRLRSAACPVRAWCGRRVRGGAVHDGRAWKGSVAAFWLFGLQGHTRSRVGGVMTWSMSHKCALLELSPPSRLAPVSIFYGTQFRAPRAATACTVPERGGR